jgi:hypothetical protein
LPKLDLTAKPIENIVPQTWLLLPPWSDVISTPKVFYPDKPNAATPSVIIPLPVSAVTAAMQSLPPKDPTQAGLVRELRRSRIRGFVWMGVAAVQVIYLVVSFIQPN